MKLESLRLKDFVGIQRGLSLSEISIDFSKRSGLTAFDGQNGAGKSTILENLHGYPQLASREGALYHHVNSRSAEKELSFTYAGSSYRTLLKINCQSEKSEGFIWKDGHSEVKGGIREYGKYIQALLGSPDLFFSSVFCAQGSKKLSEMTAGQIKTLFAEFLRLDRFQAWEETAKQAGNILSGKVSSLDIRRAAFTERMSGADKLRVEIGNQRAVIERMENHREGYRKQIQEARTRIDSLHLTISKNALAEAHRADAQQTIDRLTKDMAREKATSEAELEAVRAKYRELAAESAKADAVLKDREVILGAAEKEKQVDDKISAQLAENDRLNIEMAAHQKIIHGLETEIQELRQAMKDLENDNKLREIENQYAELTAKEREFQLKIYHAREKISALGLKDSACQSSTCSFIVDALDAKKILPTLHKELSILNAILLTTKNERGAWIEFLDGQKKEIAGELIVFQRKLNAAKDAGVKKTNDLISIRENLTFLRLELAKNKALSNRQAELQVAEARKADLEARRLEAESRGKTLKALWEKREDVFNTDLLFSRSDLADIEKEIDPEAEGNLRLDQKELAELEQTYLPGVEKEIQEARESLTKLQGDLERMKEAGQELQVVEVERGRLQTDMSEWLYIKAACSKNGLQALEIDGSAPLITGYANNLLAQAFGPLYSVRLRTQDDEGREVLDIVTIGEDGEEVLLDNLSGGQKVWILMALRLAMTLLSKEKSGHAFLTAFADELDGALDPENALNFVNMYRSFMQVGGFENFMFVSHKPSCRALADHVLCFEPGKDPFWK